jgi:glycerol-3-phosphate dehydrogenase (NAD(P)+)
MKYTQNVSIIGCGRWGTFLAWYLVKHKGVKEVLLYGLENSTSFQELKLNRKNEYLDLSDEIKLTSNLDKTLQNEYIIISIDAQNLRCLAKELNKYNLNGKTFILAMKGIDIETKDRLSQVMIKNINQNIRIAVLLGPGHVEDYTRGVPNCAVIDGMDRQVKEDVVELMRTPLMRLYYGDDLIGNEIGGAYKNVIGIAAGILDGLDWSSLKGALMARSVSEVGKFIEKMNGNPHSACGLAFLGDFEATLFSKYSNNRMFGELFIKGGRTNKNCEGFYTLKAVYEMSNELKLDMPITNALYNIIYEGKPVREWLNKLFGRDLKDEF